MNHSCRINKTICTDPTWVGRADCTHCAICDHALFAGLPLDELNGTPLVVDAYIFPPHHSLYLIGEPGRVLYTVRRGMLKLVSYLPDGTERIVSLLTGGDSAGIEVVVGSAYKHTAITLTETEVCRIPLSVVERLDLLAPQLARQLRLRWQRALDNADRSLIEFATGTAEARIAHLLLYLSAQSGDSSGFDLSRHDMGSLLGITAETASRTMADLKRRGAVTEVHAGHTFRCDRALLTHIANHA
jgi:CRP-like cAMP-binding protein